MKIIVIHNNYQQYGGEKLAVESQIRLLRDSGQWVIPFTRENSEVELFNFNQRISFFPNTLFSLSSHRDIITLVRKERPHIAHVHNVFPLISPSVYLGLKEMSVPIVQTVHNFRFLCPNGLFYTHGKVCEKCKFGNTLHAVRLKCYRDSYLLSALYASAVGVNRYFGTFSVIDRFIALTEFTAKKLIESGLVSPKKISILGNFLPDPLPEPGSFKQRQPYLLFLGRLSPEKGVSTLINAVHGIPGLALKIAGEGPSRQELELLVQANNLTNVEFLGQVSGDQKWELLRNALAVIIPSLWYENFPITAAESMAAGTPVIASRIGSLPYVVQDGRSGILFQSGDHGDLRSKILYLISQKEMAFQMGFYGRNELENRFSAKVQYDSLMRIYNEVLH